MPKPLNIFCPFLPALDEWKLEAALRDAAFSVRVACFDRNTGKIVPGPNTSKEAVKAFVAGWVAGSLSY